MIISNQEKQILQKDYAEKIKTRAATLKDLIQQDRQEAIDKALREIDKAGSRIMTLEHDSLKDLEQELKDRGPTVTVEDAVATGGKIYG